MANFPKHHPFILDFCVVSNYRRVEAIEPALHLLEEIADSSPPTAGQLDQEGRDGADSFSFCSKNSSSSLRCRVCKSSIVSKCDVWTHNLLYTLEHYRP